MSGSGFGESKEWVDTLACLKCI